MVKRTAVVTGGSGGIGRACARVLVERGYDVLLVARREIPLAAAASDTGARHLRADCTDETDVHRIIDAAGRLDLLVHTAGVVAGGRIEQLTPERFHTVIEANLTATYLMTRAALGVMDAGARVILLSSTAALKGVAGFSAYSASKAAMNAFATAVAAEVEPRGIGVHLVTPGPVRTEMVDGADHADLWLLEPEDVAAAVGWIESLPPRLVVREIVMRCAMSGPFAPVPLPATADDIEGAAAGPV